MSTYLNLKNIVLLGRTYDEYARFFSLPEAGILRSYRILDAASGVSSFCPEARKKGIRVTASDRIYSLEPEVIESKCHSDLQDVARQLSAVADRYIWDYYRNIDHLKDCRELAYKKFVEDYTEHSENYITTEYPHTDFKDNQFTLTLVSHFLFLYEDFLDYEFHKQTILELARITDGEILIYPLVNFQGGDSEFLPLLLEDGDLSGLKLSVRDSGCSFMKNADKMLSISARK